MSLDAVLDRRALIISGKGGVGKTTVAAALGVLAARHGRGVLLCEVEGKHALSALFGLEDLTSSPTALTRNLYGMNISPEASLRDYFEVQFHLKRIARPLVTSQLVYYVTHAAPGLRDILMLGTVWHEATRKRRFDLVVLDTPAAGHAVSMLASPEGFLHAVPVGMLANHARELAEFLKDPGRVSIHLVSLAEEMPVNETIETTHLLEERLRMDVAHIFLNMLYPPLDSDLAALERDAAEAGGALDSGTARALFECGRFYRARRALQQEQRSTLVEALGETAPIIDVPFLFRESLGGKEIELLADEIEARLTP